LLGPMSPRIGDREAAAKGLLPRPHPARGRLGNRLTNAQEPAAILGRARRSVSYPPPSAEPAASCVSAAECRGHHRHGRELRRAARGGDPLGRATSAGRIAQIARRTGMNSIQRRMFRQRPDYFRARAGVLPAIFNLYRSRRPIPGTPAPAPAARAAGTAWRSSAWRRARRSCAGNRGRAGRRQWWECCRSWK